MSRLLTTAKQFSNPSDDEIRALLARAGTIAVVGLSSNPGRPSYGVAASLQAFGYRIIPVNPRERIVHGQVAVPDLSSLAEPVDLVDVFRRPEHVSGIVDEAIRLGLPAIWLQMGVVDDAAAARAKAAGLVVVMDRCIYREYLRLM
jgi:predicted CoA-binding protein